MKKLIAKLAVGAALVGSLVTGAALPATAHGTCTFAISSMSPRIFQSDFTGTAVGSCQYTHAKNVITAFIQRKNPGGSWFRDSSIFTNTQYGTYGAGVSMDSFSGCQTGGYVPGRQYRGYISSFKVYNSSGSLVHSIVGAVGPVYTC